MSGGIVKYFEMDGYGRKLNRVLYAFSSRRRTSAQGEGANDEIKAIRRATGRG
jgi:hypothetical protein